LEGGASVAQTPFLPPNSLWANFGKSLKNSGWEVAP